LDNPSYVYEFVVDSDGSTFKVAPATTPIAYFKVAVGFNAIFNTGYTKNMIESVEGKLESSNGFQDGVAEDGRVVSTIIDRTNGLIISAARYAIENNNFSTPSWQKSDLAVFPKSFIQDGVTNNTVIVIGESKQRGPVGAAQTIDTIGGMLITERLARESSNGSLKAAMDGWITKYDSSTGNVTLLDNTMNLIIVGNPGINLLSYYYNSLRDSFGEPLVPVLFVENSTESYNYLYVPTSGSIYSMEFGEQGRIVVDYGVIMVFQDQPHRYVAMVYGLGAGGTLGACQVLRDYDLWGLHGSAVVVKSYVDATRNYPSNSSIVEVVP